MTTEEKQRFIELLEPVFIMADINVCGIELEDDETVCAYYFNGCKKRICIAADSKLGIIRDIAKSIDD